MEKQKRNVGLYIIIIILCVALTVAVCYIVFKKDNKLTKVNENSNDQNNVVDNSQNNNNKQDDLNKVETISIDSSVVNDTMKRFSDLYISEADLYRNNFYDISNLSNYDLVATAFKNIDSSYVISACEGENSKSVTFDYLNSVLKKYLVNKSININTIKSLEIGSSYPNAQYEVYNIGINIDDNSSITLIGPCDGELGPRDFINKKIVKAEKNTEYLYIYVKQAFAKYNTNLSVDYYSDYDKNNVIEKNINPDNLDINWDLYKTYKYSFKLINNAYYFEKLELLVN